MTFDFRRVISMRAAMVVLVMAVALTWAQAGDGELPDAVTKHEDIAYAEIEGAIAGRLSLDLYRPEGAEDAPVMVYVHGGGWRTGDKAAVSRKPRFLCGAGWLLVSVNYRLVPQVTPADQVRDIALAIAWVGDHAVEYGGDPARIFLMGHSAGAHLAALVATDELALQEAGRDLTTIRGVVVLDTATLDVPAKMERGGAMGLFGPAFGDDPEFWREVSPQHHIEADKGIPPFLVVMANKSWWRLAQARAFTEALTDVGVRAEVFEAPEHTHSSLNHTLGTPGDPATQAVAEFLTSLTAED